MLWARVMLARMRGRTLRRLDRQARLGESWLPGLSVLRGGGDMLPPLDPPPLRVVGGGPVPVDRPDPRGDRDVDEEDRSTDETGDGPGDEHDDGPGDERSHRLRSVRPVGDEPSLLPPRPVRAEPHDWDDGPPESATRRPLVPGWVRDPWPTLRWWVSEKAHQVAFHALRSHVYAGRAVAWTPRGLSRIIAGLYRWVTDAEGKELRWWTVERRDALTYLHLARVRKERVRNRGTVVLAVLVAVLVAGLVGWSDPMTRAVVVLAVVGIGGWFGRPADGSLFDHPQIGTAARRITPDMVTEAFCAAGLCHKHGTDYHQTLRFIAPGMERDGKGSRAVVDLPAGHTATKAIKRREAIAAGLGIDEMRLFMNRVRGDEGAAGRLELWIAHRDPYARKPQVSPLTTAQRWRFWDGVPFGVNARGALVTLYLVLSCLLIGAIPRMGKTYAARLVAAAAILDPSVRVIVFSGKKAGWAPCEQVAHRYAAGPRDAVVKHLVDVLAEVEEDMNARFDRLDRLPSKVCPDSQVTPSISADRRLNMPLVVFIIDEVQVFLEHAVYGDRILDALTNLAKVAPAAGIMLVLCTQRPDGEVIKPRLRDNIGTRFALKTMTWQSSDTILGAKTAQTGHDSSRFLRSHKGVGILLGADDNSELAEQGPDTLTTHLLDLAAFERICARGRDLREANGTLTGSAAGEVLVAEAAGWHVLEDVNAVFEAGEDRLWSQTICERLSDRNPSVYGGWGPVQLANALRPYGVKTGEQVWDTAAAAAIGPDEKPNKRGIHRQSVLDALDRHTKGNP